MGCANSADKDKFVIIVDRFLRAIESGNPNAIYSTSGKYLRTRGINEVVIEVQGLSLNPLGYAVWLGKIKSFFFLHKSLSASIKAMEQLFERYEISSLHVICAKGYIDILRYYLPYYIEEVTEFPEVQEILLSRISYIAEETFTNVETKPKYQPIHLAVIQEQVNIITLVYKYFETKAFVPKTLDLGYNEANSGENCALLACRYGKYRMVKMLHQTCKLNFRVKNYRGLNAINILIEGSRERIDKSYFYCLRYLVETVCLDVEHNYEHNLLWAEDNEMVEYLEFKLKEIGVNTSKKQLQQLGTKPLLRKMPSEDMEKPERPLFYSEYESEPEAS